MPEMINGLEGFDDPTIDFTHEREDPEYVRATIHNGQRLNTLAQYWVDKYGSGEGLNFSKEQELLLATHIQDGLSAQEILLKGNSGAVTADLAHRVCRGLRAERALVENNLRFAFLYARESVGIKHEGVRDRFIKGQATFEGAEQTEDQTQSDRRSRGWKPGRPQRSLGTYRPLSSMKSPRASLEDRYSMAAIGLVKAARKFDPEYAKKPKSSFISFAAWDIQHQLDEDRYTSEHAGVRLPTHVAAKLNKYFKDNPSVSVDHIVPPEVEELLRVEESREFPENFGQLSEGDIEELQDPWSEDDRPRGLEEVLEEPFDDLTFNLAHNLSKKALHDVLQTVSEVQGTVIRLRFGIGRCACHAEVEGFAGPHTLDEIGQVIGKTRERVRQIESKTMAELRHPSRSQYLSDLFDYLSEADSLPAGSIWRGDAIQLVQGKSTHVPDPEHPQDLSAAPPFMSDEQFAVWQERQIWLERQKHRESWQAYADEPWDMPLRELPHPASEEQAEDMAHILDQLPAFYFSKSFGAKSDTMYPLSPLNIFQEKAGRAVLLANQVSYVWQEFITHTYPKLMETLGDDFEPNRVGQMFSRIISEYVNDNDVPVQLRIPEYADDQIGYLASNLGLGRVEITGNPGDYLAAWNHGFADVTVYGSTGDSAGALMKDNARLFINGSAGHALGIGANDEAEIFVTHAASIGNHGQAVTIEQRYP